MRLRWSGRDSFAAAGDDFAWMLAPKGIGPLYIRREVQNRVQPALLHDGYKSYAASGVTRGVPRVLGAGVTMDFHDTIGRERIHARCCELCAYLASQLEDIPGLHPMTPDDADLSCALQPWAREKGDSGEIVGRMRNEHQILLKPAQSTYAYCDDEDLPRESYNAIRFSTHIFNSESDVDRAIDILRKLLAKL